jgi:hypothetical protein
VTSSTCAGLGRSVGHNIGEVVVQLCDRIVYRRSKRSIRRKTVERQMSSPDVAGVEVADDEPQKTGSIRFRLGPRPTAPHAVNPRTVKRR